MNVTALSQPVQLTASQPRELAVKVDLDDRCFLFPDGKIVSNLMLVAGTERNIAIDAVFLFNQTHRPPRIVEMSLTEAQGFVRELLNAVYYAKTSFFLGTSVRVTINVAANGYHIEFLRSQETVELLVSAGSIWRFIKGVLSAVDGSAPVVSN